MPGSPRAPRLSVSLGKGERVKPPVFAYLEPRTVAETTEILAAATGRKDGATNGATNGGTVLLAGGQSLVPLLNRRRVRPAALVDLNRVEGLDTVALGEHSVRIGALVRLRTLENDHALRAVLPVLPEAVRQVAYPQIRSRSTLGGSLCHADPAAELPALALALGARLRLRSTYGERIERADDFYLPGGRTTRRHDELLTEIEFPLRDAFRHGFTEIPRHGERGYPLVGVCVAVGLDGTGTVTVARVAGAGAADRPHRLTAAEEALAGKNLVRLGRRGDGLADVLGAVEVEAAPRTDPYGSAAFRRALLRTALRRTVSRLADGTEAADGEDRP